MIKPIDHEPSEPQLLGVKNIKVKAGAFYEQEVRDAYESHLALLQHGAKQYLRDHRKTIREDINEGEAEAKLYMFFDNLRVQLNMVDEEWAFAGAVRNAKIDFETLQNHPELGKKTEKNPPELSEK